jgi:hypothetical protein
MWGLYLSGALLIVLFALFSCSASDDESSVNSIQSGNAANPQGGTSPGGTSQGGTPQVGAPQSGASPSQNASGNALIIDHTSTDLDAIPPEWIEKAKETLHIAYGHTSHGSQITSGMEGLASFKGSLYAYNSGGVGGALDLRDQPFSGASDLGDPDRTAWAISTRSYLNQHPEINVVMWAWCSQADGTAEEINLYLSLMSELEKDYPDVCFVYMTGHLDGTGLTGNLNVRNNQIRQYCRANGKILYDFADIETYDPDGVYYGDRIPNDNCDYDSGRDGVRDANWAIQWQNSHVEGVDWYSCYSAHSQPLNANLKAYAAWRLWATIAVWRF